jgi:hypothetical protein
MERPDCPAPHLISRLAYGELAPRDRAAIEVHVLECSACLEDLKQLYQSASPAETGISELLRILLKKPPTKCE